MSNASSSCFRVTLKASTAALIALVLAGAARANPIKEFVVSGTAENVSDEVLGTCPAGATCRFSGRMGIDVAPAPHRGTIRNFNITFPGVFPFFQFNGPGQSSNSSGWTLGAIVGTPQSSIMTLQFTRTPPGSLLDFDGGSIIGLFVRSQGLPVCEHFSGRVTAVTEPSSLALLGAGLLPAIAAIRRTSLNR